MATQRGIILRYSKTDSELKDFIILKDDVLIGRADECDICLDDPEVSRFHASLHVEADSLWLLDMNSKNGTFIDDEPVEPNRRIRLKSEQAFSMGGYTFHPIVSATGGETVIMAAKQPAMYDLEALRKSEFPRMLDWANLDNAASAPAPERTLRKMQETMENKIATSQWHLGSYPLELIGSFLSTAADFINAESPQEMVYVEGCSMGLNLFAQSLDLQPGDNVVFCDLEYPANAYCWMSLQRDGIVIKQIPAAGGGLTLEALRSAVDERTRVVAASAVQFFSGHRTDLAAIGRFCRERNVLFVVDAIQAIGHFPIDVRRMNIDVLVTGGHKSLMTATGIGFMYVRRAVCEALKPRVVGSLSTSDWVYYLNYDMTPHPGSWRFLVSTPNFVGMAGMIESMKLLNELNREAINRHTTRLAVMALLEASKRGYRLTTPQGEHGSIATFQSKAPKAETEAMVAKLYEESRVAVARQVDRQGNAHFRMSFHCYNTEEDILSAFEGLDKLN